MKEKKTYVTLSYKSHFFFGKVTKSKTKSKHFILKDKL